MSFIKNRFIVCSPAIPEIRSYEYTVIGCTIFPAASAQDILGIDIISYLDAQGTYDIQIVDKTKNNLIAEQTFSNETLDIQSFDPERIIFQPVNSTIIEVSARLRDGKASALKFHELKIWCH